MPAPAFSLRSGERQQADVSAPRPHCGAGFTPAIFLSLSASLLLSLSATAADTKKITYEDDVLPIFRDNCLKCHNPDKLKGDLDLSSFSATIKGGGSGVTLNARDPDGSLLFKSITHAEEPEMPPKSKLADKEIALIRQWIEGGLLQGVNSKAIASNKPTVDLALKSVAVGKPEGPPPMPGPLALEPFVRAIHGSPLGAVAASPWAPVVALAGARQISLYNTTDLEFLGVLPFPEGVPCDVKFSRNGKLLLASGGRGGHSGLVVVWDISTGQRVITVGDQFDSVLAADLSADQQWIALGGPDRLLKIYRTKDGALEHRIKKHTEWVTAVEFSPDSKFLATGDRNGGVVLWEAATGQEMFTMPGHRGAITAITWRGDSELFASASEDGTLKLWKASDGSALRSLNANPGGSLAARFTHDGRVVTSGRDNKIQIWDTSGKNLGALPFKGDLPNRVTFSDDGKRVIGSDWQGKVFVWDVKTAKVVGELAANPPTLAERVQQSTQRIESLQAELARATTAHVTATAEAKKAQANLDQRKQSLATAKTQLAADESAAKALTDQLAAAPTDEALKSSSAIATEQLATSRTRFSTLQKELAEATKRVAATNKSAADAKKTVTQLTIQLAAAKTALSRWQTAQDRTKAVSPVGKVSALETTSK